MFQSGLAREHIYTYTPSHSLQSNSLTPASLLSFFDHVFLSTVYKFVHSSPHSITDKVIFNVCMFGASMNALVFGKIYGGLVVLEDRCFSDVLV